MLQDLFPRGLAVDPRIDRMFDDMTRFFNQAWSSPWRTASGGLPAVELWSDPGGERAALTIDVPGCRPEDIDVSVIGNTVRIKGRRRVEGPSESGAVWLLRERADAEWDQAIALPFEVEAGREEASFRDGVLCVTLQRSAKDRPRRIPLATR